MNGTSAIDLTAVQDYLGIAGPLSTGSAQLFSIPLLSYAQLRY